MRFFQKLLSISGFSIAATYACAPFAAAASHPSLDATTLIFSYDKMTGTAPDFGAYAEAMPAVQAATVFNKDSVRAAEAARLKSRYNTLDPHGVFNARINVELGQYDVTGQYYPTGFGESNYIPYEEDLDGPGVHIETPRRHFGVQFLNHADIAHVPMTSAAAESFAHRFNLQMTPGLMAGSAVLELTYRLSDVPPSLDENGTKMVNAVIQTARLVSDDGREMYTFPISSSTTAQIPQATLHAADIQGLRLAMPVADAVNAAHAGFQQSFGAPERTGLVLLFNGLKNATRAPKLNFGSPTAPTYASPEDGYWVTCGQEQIGGPTFDQQTEAAAAPSFHDCLAIKGKPDRLTAITSVQHLGTVSDINALKAKLDAKYGIPVATANDGAHRSWVGTDPAAPGNGKVRIDASIEDDYVPGAPKGSLLVVSAQPYDAPNRAAPAVQQASAPKL